MHEKEENRYAREDAVAWFLSTCSRMVIVLFTSGLFVVLSGFKVQKNKAPHTLDVKRWMKKRESSSDEETQDIFEEQDYVSVLGIRFPGILERNTV